MTNTQSSDVRTVVEGDSAEALVDGLDLHVYIAGWLLPQLARLEALGDAIVIDPQADGLSRTRTLNASSIVSALSEALDQESAHFQSSGIAQLERRFLAS